MPSESARAVAVGSTYCKFWELTPFVNAPSVRLLLSAVAFGLAVWRLILNAEYFLLLHEEDTPEV